MYLTKAQLQRIEDSSPHLIQEQRLFNAISADSTIFLSHKHQEKKILLQVKAFFEKLGMKVYVDWMKGNMQHPTDAATAKELKKQISKQDKFILIATDAAINAPWCNWELGLADQIKDGADKLAILPIEDTSGTWRHNEYLRIYPSIEYLDGKTRMIGGAYIPEGYYVLYPDKDNTGRTFVPLNDWLKKGMPQVKMW